jgi:hypothetical protein
MKPDEEYNYIAYFTKYKKHPVVWCKDCQRMYVEFMKEEQRKNKMKVLQEKDQLGVVSFH